MDSGKNSDNDFSMDTKSPQSDIDPRQTKVATKTLACPPGRVPSSTSATAALPLAPIALPRPMGQHEYWPRCSHVSRMGKRSGGSGAYACARGIRPAACVSQFFFNKKLKNVSCEYDRVNG